MDSESIKDRLAHILRAKNITATQFAEIMQIQPSNVSHLLNGRNKPSWDFLIKLKEVFPEYSLDWVIMGKKPITVSSSLMNLNEDNEKIQKEMFISDFEEDNNENILNHDNQKSEYNRNNSEYNNINYSTDKLKQIIYIYEDQTFEVYDIRRK